MVQMGFDLCKAEQALRDANGDVARAVASLFGEAPVVPPTRNTSPVLARLGKFGSKRLLEYDDDLGEEDDEEPMALPACLEHYEEIVEDIYGEFGDLVQEMEEEDAFGVRLDDEGTLLHHVCCLLLFVLLFFCVIFF
jgi:hypothetical protein